MNRSAPRAVGDLLVNAVPQLGRSPARRASAADVGHAGRAGGGPPRAAAGARATGACTSWSTTPLATRIDAARAPSSPAACTRRFPRSIRFASAWAPRGGRRATTCSPGPAGGAPTHRRRRTRDRRGRRCDLRSGSRPLRPPAAGPGVGRRAQRSGTMMFGSAVVRLLLLAGVLAGCATAGAGPGADDARAAAAVLARKRHVGRGVLPVLGGADAGCRAAASRTQWPRCRKRSSATRTPPTCGCSSRSGWSAPISRPRRSPPPGGGAARPRATCRAISPWPSSTGPRRTARGGSRAGERSIKLNPDAEDAYLTLARYLGAEGLRQGARGAAPAGRAAAQERRRRSSCSDALAIETESWDEAITRLTARGRARSRSRRRVDRARVRVRVAEPPDEAVEVYKKAVKANPDNAGVRRAAGRPARPLGRYGEAQAEIEALTELAPRTRACG